MSHLSSQCVRLGGRWRKGSRETLSSAPKRQRARRSLLSWNSHLAVQTEDPVPQAHCGLTHDKRALRAQTQECAAQSTHLDGPWVSFHGGQEADSESWRETEASRGELEGHTQQRQRESGRSRCAVPRTTERHFLKAASLFTFKGLGVIWRLFCFFKFSLWLFSVSVGYF